MTPDTAALLVDHYDYDCDGHCDDCGERHPCTVRALCDAADEVKRERSKHLTWAVFAVRDHDAYARPFALMRDTDVSGVSGTGVVADGCAFPDGTVTLRWRGGNPTSVVFHDNGIESVEAIHGHGGNTRIVWLAEDLETTAEVAAVYAERDASRTAHAALVADLRALHRTDLTDTGERPGRWVVIDADDLDALLDRHAPEEGR